MDRLNQDSDRIRLLIEKALQVGRSYQSAQTGFLHYYDGMPISTVHQTIPVYENALFILALFRSRLVENIQEAKQLLQKILFFQVNVNERESYFPIYLHQYPICNDSEIGVRLIAPFYWILKNFGHVLGEELKSYLEKALSKIIKTAFKNHLEQPFPYSIEVRLAAGLQAIGKLLDQPDWKKEGETLLHSLTQPTMSWCSTSYLSDILIAHQMIETTASDWTLLEAYLKQTWDSKLGCYIGPCVREWQNIHLPITHFYDLMMNVWLSEGQPKSKCNDIAYLEAVLINSPLLHGFQSLQDDVSYQVEGLYKDQQWLLNKTLNYSWTALEKKGSPGPVGEKTFTPFRFVVGDKEQQLHTFVCQGGKFSQLKFNQLNSESLELLFDLDEDDSIDEIRDKSRDICFYWDDRCDWQVLVENDKSNTFELGQSIQFIFQSKLIFSLSFQLFKGEGQFLGHLAKGNRPSQFKSISEEKHYQAYDRTLFIRTIRKKGPCMIKATFCFSSS